MFGSIVGSILLLFGLVVVGYTIYSMAVHTPTTVTTWVFNSFYIVGGLVISYYGYQTLYPPQPSFLGVAGGRRWYK
jgi:hypothetical protein